ncbi:hypothetical protein [Desulfonatronospira sp.]|uniref:hypothetical protein n=1 Tax=Desulfonatronospira sp. TaxID=1962951 RepID=UPI0025BB2528|nr:hypothetical protein [Desulfonatronospira sp.]
MKRIFFCVFLAAIGMMMAKPPGAESDPVVTLDADHYLHLHFEDFALQRMYMLNRNYAGTKDNPRMEQTENGLVGRYSKAHKNTLKVNVRQTQSELSPFIGVMKYVEVRYESNGECRESVANGTFDMVRARSVTEIFRFVQDEWQ